MALERLLRVVHTTRGFVVAGRRPTVLDAGAGGVVVLPQVALLHVFLECADGAEVARAEGAPRRGAHHVVDGVLLQFLLAAKGQRALRASVAVQVPVADHPAAAGGRRRRRRVLLAEVELEKGLNENGSEVNNT